MTTRRVGCTVILALFGLMTASAAPILILPVSLMQGLPGSTVGWGYQIVNDTTDYLLVNNSYFCGPGGDPQFTTCGPNNGVPRYDGLNNFGPKYGVYTDYIAANATLIPPSSSPSQPYSFGSPGTGVGAYTIDLSAPLNSVDAGNIFVTYDAYVGNPFVAGVYDFSGSMSAAATVVVVPEPESFSLAAIALGVLAAWRRKG